MKALVISGTAVAVMGLAVWAYQQNYRTQDALREVARLNDQIGAAHSRLRMLNAEWAYLNRPDRLQELALINFARLELMPLMPEAFGEVSQIALPPAPLSQITDPVDINFVPDPNEEPL
jgi:hypothetical protein